MGRCLSSEGLSFPTDQVAHLIMEKAEKRPRSVVSLLLMASPLPENSEVKIQISAGFVAGFHLTSSARSRQSYGLLNELDNRDKRCPKPRHPNR